MYKLIYIQTIVTLNSILIFYLLFHQSEITIELMQFTGNLVVSLQMDGLSTVFIGLIGFLWPFATLYSFEYMKHESHENNFFTFYTITFGVTIGIALSSNLLSLYFFYELLTLVTLPLVMHTLTREAIVASRKYLYYSIGGAAFAFIGLIFMIVYGQSTNFVLGGVLDLDKIGENTNILLLVYVLSFFGFGVKGAVCPLNGWLPKASVAPTPVTALLHAVAVVNSGAYAIMRLTYYSFGTEFLKGTWAQTVVMSAVIFTILYGCSRAVKETHIKRRLAYSTISNLSYILFGVVIMTPLGLAGALCHMVFHGFMKITSFFCAGNILFQSKKQYVYELDGMAKKMPKTFFIFTISGLALMGVPGLCGFVSKWQIARAVVNSENKLAYLGLGVILISALLTAIYMLGIVIRAYFPKEGFDESSLETMKDPDWKMMIPLFVFVTVIVLIGLYSKPMVDILFRIAAGIRI